MQVSRQTVKEKGTKKERKREIRKKLKTTGKQKTKQKERKIKKKNATETHSKKNIQSGFVTSRKRQEYNTHKITQHKRTNKKQFK